MQFILNIASKDLLQMIRDRKTFLFLLIMPVAFTLLFGYAFNGVGQESKDQRLPVAFQNEDSSALSLELQRSLNASAVIRLETPKKNADLEKAVLKNDLAAALIVPAGYGDALAGPAPLALILVADPAASAGLTARTEINTAAARLVSAVRSAQAVAPAGGAAYDSALAEALAAWNDPPVRLAVTQTDASAEPESGAYNSFAHSSPGMILQFAVAGLLTCAQVLVSERKNRSLQRLLTTSASRVQILLGHYLSILALILLQFAILILFGQLALGLGYFSQPLATLLITLVSALSIAALGLLIGVLAKSEEQAIGLSLICMFALAGLGGAWVPLEVTGTTFQTIGHITPLAWSMDGFKNILIRGQGLQAALLPAAALLAYALLFFGLASWKFKSE